MTLAEDTVDPDIDSDRFVFVDFDYTLLSSNSTELFISTCQPSAIVGALDFAIKTCVPWRLTGLAKHYRLRDYVRVMAVALLMPWNLLLWKRKAPDLFERQATAAICSDIKAVGPSRLIIISFGMRFIIRALIANSRFATVRVIATPALVHLRHFGRGKLSMAVEAVGAYQAAAATLITDSNDDDDLLNYCANGILIPRQGEIFNASEKLYLPLRYFGGVKYSKSYMIDQIFLVDLAVWVLSLSTDLKSMISYALPCTAFILSLNCIYEIGYFENDMHAAGTEAAPVLSARVARFQDYPIAIGGWVWATIFAAVGFGVAAVLKLIAVQSILPMAAAWTAALIAIRATFYIYNRLAPFDRTFAYPVLQVLKYGSIFLVFPGTILGVILTICQITTLWTNYLIYRFGGSNVKFFRDLFRTILLLFGVALLALGSDRSVHITITDAAASPHMFGVMAILLWSAARLVKVKTMQRLKRKSLITA